MQIDISTPEGNTMVALAIATRLMRQADRGKADILALQTAVFGAGSAKEARDAITKATFGSVTFVNGNEG